VTRAELRAHQADEVAKLVQSPDEYHPDPRVAAAFADVKAKRYIVGYLEGEVKKLEEAIAKKPINVSMLLGKLGITRDLLKQAQDEQKEIEEVAAGWIPETEKS
jgi:hypothetical protein